MEINIISIIVIIIGYITIFIIGMNRMNRVRRLKEDNNILCEGVDKLKLEKMILEAKLEQALRGSG